MTASTPAPRRPVGRYPERAGRSAGTAITLAALLAVFIGAVGALGWRLSNPEVTVTVRGYDVIDDQRVSVTYQVRRADPDAVLRCALRARDSSSAEVGRTTVEVPPGEPEVVRTDEIATTGRAVVGEVEECSVQ